MNKKTVIMSTLSFLIVVLVVFIIVVPVNPKGDDNKSEPSDKWDFEYDGGVWSSMEYIIEEREIDSCQYIIIFGVEGRNIIHKANCRNPFHSRQKISN